MPLSNASRLADFGTGIGTAGAIIQVDNVNQRLGVGTTAPTATLGVAGIVSATAFYGDGSNLDGVASAGLGTALSEEEFNPLTVIYQTSDTLSVGATITVDPPDATTKVAYTQYADIKLEGDADLIIADGDDFIPDILGLSTEGFSFSNANGNGIFDTVYTDNIENAAGRGAPNFPLGITVTGISTLSGNVSIGGTLTYEDVTNVDSVGIVTARSGIDITAGGANIVGVVTATSFDGINVTAGDVVITNGSLGVGLNNPGLKLHIQDGALPSAPAPNGNCDMVLEGTTNTGIQFLSGTQTQLRFGDADSTAAGAIIYKHTDDNFKLNFSNSGYLSLNDGGGENLRFTPNNEIGIGGANYGTSGQVLTSGGSGAPVQWADAGGAVWEYVSTIANPNTSTVQFTGFTTAYLAYKVYFFGVAVNTNNDRPFRAQVFLNNTLKTSGYRYYGPYGDDSGSGTAKMRSDAGDQGIWFSGQSNRGNCAYSGEIYFPMNRVMSGNGGYKTWYARCMSNYTNMIGGGTHDDSQNTQVTGVSFDSPDPYNITNGEFFLYRMPRPV